MGWDVVFWVSFALRLARGRGSVLSGVTGGWEPGRGAGNRLHTLSQTDGSAASCGAAAADLPDRLCAGGTRLSPGQAARGVMWSSALGLSQSIRLYSPSVCKACFPPHPCMCILIIRGFLACFPNLTLTFLSAPEKPGIRPTGTQSEAQGEFQLSARNPGDTLCV